MAVVISTEDGCVLDHDIAIATVYRHCVSAASSSVSTLSSAHAESVGQLHILHQQSTEPSKEISPDQMCGDRCNVAQNPVILASTGFVSQHATDSNSPVQSTDVLTSSSDSAPVFNFEHPASESEPAGKNHPHRTLGRSEITGVEHHSRQLETVPEAAQVQVEVKGSEQEACVSRDNSCVRLCQLAEAESTVCLYKTPASDPEDESGSASTENDKQQVSEDKTESTIAANKLLPSQCNVHKETSGTCRPSKSDQWKNSVEKCDVFESKTQRVSLRLKHGFFTVNVPFMMDSQFEKVRRCLAQDSTLHRACGDSINTADIQNIVSKKVCHLLQILNNSNKNRIQRHNSRFFTISLVRHKPSPAYTTCTLKWRGCNHVQIMWNTLSAYHMQRVVLCAMWYEGTAQLLNLTQFK